MDALSTAPIQTTQDKIYANPTFQAAYQDQTVQGRANADAKLSGQDVNAQNAKDSAYNSQQANFDKANPAGTAQPPQTSPLTQASQANQPQNIAAAATGKNVATPQTPQDIAAALLQKNPAMTAADFMRAANQQGIMNGPAAQSAMDTFHELQHAQSAVQQYGSSSAQDLSSAISSGNLAVGSPSWNAVSAANPNTAEAMRLVDSTVRSNVSNASANALVSAAGGTPSPASTLNTATPFEKITANIAYKSGGLDPYKAYSLADALSETPQALQYRQSILNRTSQINDLNRAMQNNYNDLRKSYPNVPQSVLMGMQANANRDIESQLFDLNKQNLLDQGMLSYYTDIAQSKVTAQQEIQKDQRSQQFQASLKQYELQNQYQLASYQSGLKPEAIGTKIDPVTGMPMTTYGMRNQDGSYTPIDTGIGSNQGAPNGLPGSVDTSVARTDRNNNPIAVAVPTNGSNEYTKALDEAGIKWSYGDAFPGNGNMSTVKIDGDPVAASRAVLSNTGAIQNWYANHTGKDVLAKYGVKNNQDFKNLSDADQNAVINGIYKNEGGSGRLTNGGQPAQPANSIPKPSELNIADKNQISAVAQLAKDNGIRTSQDGLTLAMQQAAGVKPLNKGMPKPYMDTAVSKLAALINPSIKTNSSDIYNDLSDPESTTPSHTAINGAQTSVDHMAKLSELMQNSYNGSFVPANWVSQWVQKANGSEQQARIDALRSVVPAELAKSYGELTVSGIEGFANKFQSYMNPAAVRAAAQTFIEAQSGKLKPIIDQYDNHGLKDAAMGAIYTPEMKKNLAKLGAVVNDDGTISQEKLYTIKGTGPKGADEQVSAKDFWSQADSDYASAESANDTAKMQKIAQQVSDMAKKYGIPDRKSVMESK